MKRIFAIFSLAAIIAATMLLCASCKKDDEVSHVHTPGDAVVENVVYGTCSTRGSYESVVYCTGCDCLLGKTIVKVANTGHTHTPGEPVEEERDATCTTAGGSYTVVRCSECNDEISATLIEGNPEKPVTQPLDHNLIDVEHTENPTCTEPGSKYTVKECDRKGCGYVDESTKVVTETLSPLTHDIKKVFYTVKATCVKHGEKRSVERCVNSGCDYVVAGTDTLIEHTSEATGHQLGSYEPELTEPTCTEKGAITEVLRCTKCNEVLSALVVKEIPKLGHKASEEWEEFSRVDSTCQVAGNVVYVKRCTNEGCDEIVHSKTENLPLAHVAPDAPVKENNTFSTCINGGSYDLVWYCTACGGEMEKETVTIQPKNHSYQTVEKTTVEATCTKDGQKVVLVMCTACGDVKQNEVVVIEAGHTTDTRTTYVPASCGVEGSVTKTVYCTVCNTTIKTTVTVVPAEDHEGGAAFNEIVKNPTCEEKGAYNVVVRCTKCNDELSSVQKEIPALGHTESVTLEENWHNKAKDGCYDLVVYCLTCGVERSRKTVAHTPGSTVIEVHDDVVYCTTCKEELTRTYIGHVYEDKDCVRCNEYDTSVGLEYTLSEDKSHWIVTGVGSCTDEYVIIPRTYTGNYTDPETKKTTTYTLPVTEIDRWAFYDCDTVKRLLILKEISVIPDMAFYSCDNLFKIIVEQDNRTYRSADGNLYTKDGKKLMQYAIGKTSTSFKVPGDVVEIGYGAFACCTNLSKIEIGSAVTTISESAFAYCTSLTEVAIPNKVTTIGEAAFADCHNITKVTIGTGVKSIGKGAFDSCTKLTSVTFANTTGWKVSTTETGAKKGVNATELKDAAKAASHLTTKYMEYYWTR